ncbi:MFS transporter (plasmid) [Priestia sp. MF3]|uniref:MFS transporter n=1 Tax=Priestia sp. MF3 TaxID=3404779 RepID=UPI003BA12F16
MSIKDKVTLIYSNSSYFNFFIGSLTSSIGNGMYFIALTWLLLSITNEPSSVGLLMIVMALPNIFINPFIGVFIDWVDRKIVCIVADIFCACAILVIPIIYYTDFSLNSTIIYIVAFLSSLGEKVYIPSRDGLIRELTSDKELVSINSFAIGIVQTGMLLGAGLSGFLISTIGSINVILINSLSYLIGALFTFFVRKNTIKPIKRNYTNNIQSVLHDFKQGVFFLVNNKNVLKISLIIAILYTTLYATNALLPSFAKFDLNVGEKGYGIIDATWALGSIFGAFFLFSLSIKHFKTLILKYGLLILSCSIGVFSLSQNLFQASIGYMLMGACFAMTRIVFDTNLQLNVHTDFQGRVKSVVLMLISLTGLVVHSLITIFIDIISPRSLYYFLSFIMLLGCICSLYAFSEKRSLLKNSRHSL